MHRTEHSNQRGSKECSDIAAYQGPLRKVKKLCDLRIAVNYGTHSGIIGDNEASHMYLLPEFEFIYYLCVHLCQEMPIESPECNESQSPNVFNLHRLQYLYTPSPTLKARQARTHGQIQPSAHRLHVPLSSQLNPDALL